MAARLATGGPAPGLSLPWGRRLQPGFKGDLVRPLIWRGHRGEMTVKRFAAVLIATALTVGTASFAVARSGIGITVTPSTASPATIQLSH